MLDDLTGASGEALRTRPLTDLGRLTLFCLARARESDDFLAELRPWVPTLAAVLEQSSGPDALVAILTYIVDVQDLPPEELRSFLRTEVGPDVERALMSTAEQIAREARERGRGEGRAEGRKEGRVELLLKLPSARFGVLPPAHVERVRRASIDELDRWAERVLDAASLDELLAQGPQAR